MVHTTLIDMSLKSFVTYIVQSYLAVKQEEPYRTYSLINTF